MTSSLAGLTFVTCLVLTVPAIVLLQVVLPRWPRHLRVNYRGRLIPRTLGLALAVPLTAGAFMGWFFTPLEPRGAVLVGGTGLAFGALGLVDDLAGTTGVRGFAGHLRALARGRVTTGILKAGGGGVAGLVVAWLAGQRGFSLLVGGALIALSANLVNLLDVRPGRAIKGWLIAWAALLVSAPPFGPLIAGWGLTAGVLVFLPADLRERGMLGDTGANLLGGALGAVAVLTLSPAGQAAAAVVLVAMTAASELMSFSRVIDAVPALRALDRVGRVTRDA